MMVDQDSLSTLVAELRSLIGSPARVTLDDSRTPDGAVRIPGTIRNVTPDRLVVDLFFPLLVPRINSPIVIEVMARAALYQAYTSVQQSPSPQTLHLDLPSQMHPIQRRQFPRVGVAISTTVAGDSLPVTASGTIINLSAGGCGVALAERLPIGALVKMNLEATGITPTEVWAHVVRCSLSTSTAGRWEVGFAFVHLTQTQTQHLKRYVERYI
jgi:hypothetical protein